MLGQFLYNRDIVTLRWIGKSRRVYIFSYSTITGKLSHYSFDGSRYPWTQ